jgi:hypothetical protein
VSDEVQDPAALFPENKSLYYCHLFPVYVRFTSRVKTMGRVIVKIKVIPVHTIKAYGGNRNVAAYILNLGATWSLVVNVTPSPLTPGK